MVFTPSLDGSEYVERKEGRGGGGGGREREEGEEGGKGRREKIGPIFDQHGTVYGPGSVVFTPSVDGSEYVEREEGGEGGRERRERKEGEEGRRSTRDRVWTWKCRVHSFRGWIRVCGERERRERKEEGEGDEGGIKRRRKESEDTILSSSLFLHSSLFFFVFFSFTCRYWVLYHGINRLNCTPNAWACRDIRMQQMFFDDNGFPTLGYPVDPGVPLVSPAGCSLLFSAISPLSLFVIFFFSYPPHHGETTIILRWRRSILHSVLVY